VNPRFGTIAPAGEITPLACDGTADRFLSRGSGVGVEPRDRFDKQSVFQKGDDTRSTEPSVVRQRYRPAMRLQTLRLEPAVNVGPPRPTRCQRWRHHRSTYRPAGEPLDPRRYHVEEISEQDAKSFCCTHHYSLSYPASRFRVGLLRTRPAAQAELVGVAVFSVPASQAVIPKWTGLSPSLGIELGRLVLWDDCEANSESWFMARAFRLLAQALPEVQAVLSFSDPVQRTSATGTLLTPGHVGVVYQALGARHVGRSNPRTLILDPAGRTISERALTKLRNDDRGAQYTYNQLRAAGAPRRRPNEPGHTYVTRALTDGAFRRMRHPGNLAYVWATANAERWVEEGFAPQLPYPKAFNTILRPRSSRAHGDAH